MNNPERIDELAPLAALAPIAGGLARAAAAGGSLALRAGGAALRGGAKVAGAAGRTTTKTAKSLARKKAIDKIRQKLSGNNSDPQVDQELEQEVSEKCWPGYEKKGMKTMFGKRYPNCVKKKAKLRETVENLSEEGLRAWFGNSRSKGGKPGWVQVVSGKPCARQPGQKSTPKCVSSSKRASMTPAQRRSAQARKRRADPNQRFKTGAAKPTYVPTDKPKKKSKGKRK